MLPNIVAACSLCLLLCLAWAQDAGRQTQGQTPRQQQTPSQGQDGAAGAAGAPWRQVIQWENNGRRFSLLNSGAEYVPAGAQTQDRAPRVVVADAAPRPRSPRRPQSPVRRQAPSRGGSETVRGQARHPFGFGQVPDNWRQTSGGTGTGGGGTGRFQPSSGSRFRPSTGSSSSSSSTFSSSSYNPYPQYPFPGQPAFPAVPYDPSYMEPVRSFEPPFLPAGGGYGGGVYGGGGYVGGGAGGYAGAGYGGVGLGPVIPGGGEYTEDGYRYYQPYGAYVPNPAVVVQPRAAQPQPPADPLDRRYTHSLFNEDSSPAVAAPDPSVDRTGPGGGAQSSPVRSPQYEQFPPFGRPQPLPPFLPPVQPGRSSPNSAVDNPSVSVGSVYRPDQRDEVLKLITSTRPTTCPLDPIPSPIFQTIAPDLIPFITSIINTSITSGSVPSAFKSARVTPLLKKPTLDPSDAKNYRPVSLLSFLSKTTERVVSKQLSDHLSQNNLLDPNQSGFKKAHSTETALLAVTEALHAAQAASQSAVLILLDLSAAFDTVNHQLLLHNLVELGITGTALRWFSSYLTDRTYQVSWKGSLSSPCTLQTGVPQGSVLGPLLFSLYTKSLGTIITAHNLSYHCYADDTQLFLSFPPSATHVEERITACLADISQWMTSNHLKLNPDKTELLFFPAKSSPLQELTISVDNAMVTSAPTAKNLGIVLDSQLSFKTHIAAVTRSCRFTLHNIRRIRPFITQDSAQLLIQTTVISKLDYCNSLLTGLPACALKPLQLIQNAAARLVFNQPKFSHVTPLLRSLHWLPVAARTVFKTLTLAFKATKGLTAPYLSGLIKPYKPSRALRSADTGKLAVAPLKTPGQRSTRPKLFSLLAPKLWNELPPAIRTSDSLPIFRRSLKTHLFRLHLNP